jgi:hypothetical protein
MKEVAMRRAIFWLGWCILAILPLIFIAQIIIVDNLPEVELWKWAVPIVAIAMIALARSRDDVLKHHLV